jgi:F-type H+/Na+-transporting ATPase subunit alpha
MVIYLVTSGAADKVPLSLMGQLEKEFLQFVYEKHANIPEKIAKEQKFEEETEDQLKNAIDTFYTKFMKTYALEAVSELV